MTNEPIPLNLHGPDAPFQMNGSEAKATFDHWRELTVALCEISILSPVRSESKDAMVGIQKIIIACREERSRLHLYPRDALPLDAVVNIRFYYESEWTTIREAIWAYNEKWKRGEREAILARVEKRKRGESDPN